MNSKNIEYHPMHTATSKCKNEKETKESITACSGTSTKDCLSISDNVVHLKNNASPLTAESNTYGNIPSSIINDTVDYAAAKKNKPHLLNINKFDCEQPVLVSPFAHSTYNNDKDKFYDTTNVNEYNLIKSLYYDCYDPFE